MTEILFLGVFSAALLGCVLGGQTILYAMVFGFLLFFVYGLRRSYTAAQVLRMAWSGVRTIRNILLTFVLIGIITAFWRAGGTIPFIVYYAAQACSPSLMLLLTFWLCCIISVLTGTAFGTAATMGVICMTMANSMGISPAYTGGAVLAGVYFGDRCSPMSTSALLVSTLTATDLFRNIHNMIRTSIVPFFAASGLYFAAGFLLDAGTGAAAVQEIFAASFFLHPLLALPAVCIIALSLLRIDVKRTMSVSIIMSLVLAVWLEQVPPAELPGIALWGYHPESAELAALLGGGGIVSMASVFAIVCLSSCYAGIFEGTGFLHALQGRLEVLSRRITPFGGILLTSVLSGMIACNQTLTIMLTHQLCHELEPVPEVFAQHLENTAVVLSPLIPWSIAGAVPLAAVAAPPSALLAACYLYFLPLWNLYTVRRKGI